MHAQMKGNRCMLPLASVKSTFFQFIKHFCFFLSFFIPVSDDMNHLYCCLHTLHDCMKSTLKKKKSKRNIAEKIEKTTDMTGRYNFLPIRMSNEPSNMRN